LDVEALARGAPISAGPLSRAFRLAYGGDLSVTEVCFAVGCLSLGTFSTRFAELVGMPPAPTGARRDHRGHHHHGLEE